MGFLGSVSLVTSVRLCTLRFVPRFWHGLAPLNGANRYPGEKSIIEISHFYCDMDLKSAVEKIIVHSVNCCVYSH